MALRSKYVRWSASFCAMYVLMALCVRFAAGEEGAEPRRAKNVIILIGDGCGYNHLTASRYYRFGQNGEFVFERFPVRIAVSTFSAEGHGYDPAKAWKSFEWFKQGATDSAAAATALSTGIKVANKDIGAAVAGGWAPHLMDDAKRLGKAAGVVTSVQLSHATPAGFVAHNANRNNYEEIAREMIERSRADVIMGCGHPLYDNDGRAREKAVSWKYVGGEALWKAVGEGSVGADADGDGRPDPWRLVETRDEFKALASGETPKRVLGVARVHETLQERRSGDRNAAPYKVALTASVPTLAEMTAAALNILDDDPDGLFLMIEGGAIDWASHDNLSGRVIEETLGFVEAVDAVVAWVEKRSNWNETLVIVTADHETGYLWGPGTDPDKPEWRPVVDRGAGELPGMAWFSKSHTNQLVPLFARGAGADALAAPAAGEDARRGPYIDNTHVPKAVRQAMK